MLWYVAIHTQLQIIFLIEEVGIIVHLYHLTHQTSILLTEQLSTKYLERFMRPSNLEIIMLRMCNFNITTELSRVDYISHYL